MRTQTRKIMAMGTACLFTALLSASAAETVLQLFGNKVMRYEVENGVWTNLPDFADNSNNYGGASRTFKGLASDGFHVFVGEQGLSSSRILEFDMKGNYTRTLASPGNHVEYMNISRDGYWLYANIGVFDGITTNDVVHRYNIITGDGGLFIPNSGTNELGETLWLLNTNRGIAEDENGVLWVSSRGNGTAFKFDAVDGSYLGKVTGMGNIEGLYYYEEDKQIYGTSMGDATYVINTTNDTKVIRSIAGADNRLGITRADNQFISARYLTKDIAGYDFDALTVTSLVGPLYTNPRELITLPLVPLRPKLGELLISETISNRIKRISFDVNNAYDVEEEYFAGGDDVTYDGISLRQPRGVVAYSNYVYVAEGVVGGRILKFSKWGNFKSVALDFSQTSYSDCMPAALAITPDGSNLYVTDAHTLYAPGGSLVWSNTLAQGYFSTNTYGKTVYKVNLTAHSVSIFANTAILDSGKDLIEPRGVAVDAAGRVYFNSWYNATNDLDQGLGYIYQVDSSANVLTGWLTGNLSTCYYDPIGYYDPPAGNVSNPGPGIILTGFVSQDIFWVEPGSTMGSTPPKLLDYGPWRTYLDVEVVNGRLFYTDPEYNNISLRTGDTVHVVFLSGLAEPTYMTFANVTDGEEPPPTGTVLMLH